MGGGSGIGSGAPVSPLSPPAHGPLQTIEPFKVKKPATPSPRTEERLQCPPLGLQNVGNTCYANAALQCLLNTALSHALLDPASNQIFRRYSSNPDLLSMGSGSFDSDEEEEYGDDPEIVARKEAKQREREARRKAREKLLHHEKCQWLTGALTDITRIYTAGSSLFTSSKDTKSNWQSLFHLFSTSDDNSIIDPSAISRNVHKLSPCLRPYQQEDAHEFIRTLLSTLTLDGHNKQLSSLFDGLLESAVTCQQCHRASVTRDRYMDLSLDIQGSEVQDLVGALGKFTKTELLDNDNKVFCARCNKKRVVTKGLRLATAPSILVCHLKRFAVDIYGRSIRLSKKIKYPLRLEIGDFMSRANQGRPAPYELVGVIVHAGKSCDRGHYYAYVKSGDDWYKANDEVVTKVNVDVVLDQQAYILLYEIEGMRASHGFYGCGKYHFTRSRSTKKRAEDLAAMNSEADTSISCGGSTRNEYNKSRKPSPSKIITILDSMLDFCGSTSAAEAVRDAMCDSGKKSKKKKKRSQSAEAGLKKADPIVSKSSSESNFSRVTPSEDGSSKYDHPLYNSTRPVVERMRSSSENDVVHHFSKVNFAKSKSPRRDSYRISGSLLDSSMIEAANAQKEPVYLASDPQLIKSCSSNNLLEREEEAAHSYEREFMTPNKNMTQSLHGSNTINYPTYPTRKDDDQNSDPGLNLGVVVKPLMTRRKSTSAPRASMCPSPARVRNEKRIDLPPLPTSKRNIP